MEELSIIFIYLEDCVECEALKMLIKTAARETIGENRYILNKINCEQDEAVEIGVKYNILDLPACVINEKVIIGSAQKSTFAYTLKLLKDAMRINLKEGEQCQ